MLTDNQDIKHKDSSLTDASKVARENKRNSVFWNIDVLSEHILDLNHLFSSEEAALFLKKGQSLWLSGEKQRTNIRGLHYQQQNIFLSSNTKTLGVGFGILAFKSPRSGLVLFRAPLFLKQVELVFESSEYQLNPLSNTWRINPFVQSYFLEEYQLDLTGLSSSEVLEKLANLEVQSRNSLEQLFDAPLEPLVSPSEEMKLEEGLHLLARAFLSVLDNRIIEQENWLKFYAKNNVKNNYNLKHQIGLMPSNPDSARLLQGIEREEHQYLSGCRSYDKLLTTVNLLSNALSNGKRCLVVAKHTLPLFQVQKKLLELGLGGFTFLVKNKATDFQPLLAMLGQRQQWLKKNISFSKENFEHNLEKYQRKQIIVAQKKRLQSQNVLGNSSFVDTVGKYVAANKVCGRELLNAQLNTRVFEFSLGEYEQIKKDVADSEALFAGVGTLRHPLRKLNASVFDFEDEKDALGQVEFLIETFKERGEQLLHTYITKQATYSEALKRNYYAHYDSMQVFIKKVKDFIFESKGRYGEDFELSGSTRLSFLGTFSKKYKTIQQARESLGQYYKALVQAYQARPYFEYQFLQFSEVSIPRIVAAVEDYESKLLDWRNRIPSIVDVERSRLNAQTVHFELDFEDQIKSLEFSHDLFIEELNQAQLLEEWQKSSQHTLVTRQQHIETVIEMLESIELGLRDFQGFYPWQQNWLAIPVFSRKVVKALVRVKPKNWVAAFESWYLHHCLSAKMIATEGKAKVPPEAYLEDLMKVKTQLVKQIESTWQKRQITLLKKTKKREVLMSCLNETSLRSERGFTQFLEEGLDIISTFFPVLFLTENEASSLNQLKDFEAFDLILALEKDKLDPVFASTFSSLGHRSVAVCHHNMDESLQQNGIIAYQVQSEQHQEIFKIKKQLFYDSQLQKLPTHQVKETGFYTQRCYGALEPLQQINKREAAAIFNYLNQITPNELGRYPMLGIACSSRRQAEYIHERILIEKERKPILKSLLREGLGIWSSGEQANRRYDEVLLSVVGGQDAVEDGFCLEVLDNARQSLHIFYSFDFDKILENKFTHVLAKAKGADLNNSAIEVEESRLAPFSEEVYMSLGAYFEQGRIQWRHLFDQFIPGSIMIEPLHEGQPKVIVLTNGIPSKAKQPIIEWESQVLRHLKQEGYIVFKASAEKWWHNAHHEARKLAGEIIRLDNEFETN